MSEGRRLLTFCLAFMVLFTACCQIFVSVRRVHKRQTADCSYSKPMTFPSFNARVEFCAITARGYSFPFDLHEPDIYVWVYDIESNELIAERYSSGFYGAAVEGGVQFSVDSMYWVNGDGNGDGTTGMPFPPTWWMRFTAKLP